MSMRDDPVELLQSRWLGGRGTLVLYVAILVTIAGVLGMSHHEWTAATERAEVVGLAEQVSEACSSEMEFRRGHPELCSRAERILGGGSGAVADLIHAAGAGR
jgi:hypothetical protein